MVYGVAFDFTYHLLLFLWCFLAFIGTVIAFTALLIEAS